MADVPETKTTDLDAIVGSVIAAAQARNRDRADEMYDALASIREELAKPQPDIAAAMRLTGKGMGHACWWR